MSRTITRYEYREVLKQASKHVRKTFEEWLVARPFGGPTARGRPITERDADDGFREAIEEAKADFAPDNYDVLSNSANADAAGTPGSDYIEDIIAQYAEAAFDADLKDALGDFKKKAIERWLLRAPDTSHIAPTSSTGPRRFTNPEEFETEKDSFDGLPRPGRLDLFRRGR